MPLPSYFDILGGRSLPRFRIAARIPAGLDESGAGILSLDELFALHDDLAKPFADQANPSVPEYFPGREISLLELKALIARRMLKQCILCENRCGVDRTAGLRGKCRVGERSFYASEFIHVGEEPELVPSHTVFFTGCTFECIYCQNWDISQGLMASIDAGSLADDTLTARIIARAGYSRNLNLVGGDPGPHLATILRLLADLARLRYTRPIVWNSNMYATPEAIRLLQGSVDVHLADFKYGSNEHGKLLSGIESYWDVVTRNLFAVKPVADILIRHLVIPGHVECCTSRVVEWVAENLPRAKFNLMFQYHPEYRAGEMSEIDRGLTVAERQRAMELAEKAGVLDADMSG
jgi:putative pyruvate formate lyase activating enzyme